MVTAEDWTEAFLAASASGMQRLATSPELRATMAAMAARITDALRAGNKLLIAGNGGSAADAQHIAAEFLSRLMFDRAPLAAIALTTDSSVLTASGNDYGFEHVFERQVRGLGRPGDVLLVISTSGRSPNVLAALAAGKAGGLATLAFGGADPRDLAAADIVLAAPSDQTAIAQQLHITVAHVICGLVERAMFPERAA